MRRTSSGLSQTAAIFCSDFWRQRNPLRDYKQLWSFQSVQLSLPRANPMAILRLCVPPIRQATDRVDDLFVTCSSYEQRTLAVVNALSGDYRARQAAIFVAREYANKGHAPAHLKLIRQRLRQATPTEPTLVEFDIDRPIPSMRQFEAIYGEQATKHPPLSATLDITTFPRQEMLVLLRVLDKMMGLDRVRLLYTEPLKYGSEEAGGWLTRGVKAVRAVPGFGGIQPPGKRKLLVILLGHEEERAAITWKRHQPRKCVAVLPLPGYRPELGEAVKRKHYLLFSMVAKSTVQMEVPAHGIEETRDLILRLWEAHKNTHYLVVAPLGTKLQTIGLFEAVRIQPAIQITYAVPALYNYQGFSQKSGQIWEIQMSAGPTKALFQ